MWGSHWSIYLEKAGIPGVLIVDHPFKADVDITCHKEGMPGLRQVFIPHPPSQIPDDQIPSIVARLAERLTSALTNDERKPRKKPAQELRREIFKGTLDEVNTFFYKRGWTDGLPIIPPTEEKVAKMLKATSHAPDEVVTTGMLPESQTVTVEKVATVGVMAGCEPQHMPLLLSIVEALENEVFHSLIRSTISASVVTIANGPITKEIGMNGRHNALGSGTGNKANATIGRFVRLAVICLGGSRTAISDMSSQGNPAKYSFAFAENEEDSPWEPYHVSAGFKPEQSVVTMMIGGFSHHSPLNKGDPSEIAKAIATFLDLPLGVVIMMDPLAASCVSSQGYSKKAAEEFIWSHATRTLADFRAAYYYDQMIEPVLRGREVYHRKGLWPAEYLDLPAEQQVPIFPRNCVKIVVVGGGTYYSSQAWQFFLPVSIVVDKWR